MNLSQKLTIELIRYEISSVPVDESLLSAVNDELIEEVYTLAVKIDMGYIVASALSKLGLLSNEAKSAFFTEQLATVYRYESLKYDLESISQLFEREGIVFVPLKGSVIRRYYPKPEMRTSCDVDVLVHAEDLKRGRELLEKELGFIYNAKCGHDISFWSPTQTEVELHHTLFEHDFDEKEQLDKVWDYAHPEEGHQYKYELDKAFFMFYHIVHMAKHIRSGGCGLRPFLDLAILEEKFDYDKAAFGALIAEAGLTRFTQKIFDITHMWFGTMDHDEAYELMAEYIFGGGAYGSLENQVAQTQAKAGSRFKSIVSRVFISRRELGVMYPVIQKCPVLTPVYEVVRWCRIIFKDKAQKQIAIIKHNSTITYEKKHQVSDLFEHLGL